MIGELTVYFLDIRCFDTLPPPANGSVACTNSKKLGSQCTYSCHDGYLLQGGTTVRTCTRIVESATWSGTASQCTGMLAIEVFLYASILKDKLSVRLC